MSALGTFYLSSLVHLQSATKGNKALWPICIAPEQHWPVRSQGQRKTDDALQSNDKI